MAPRQWRPPGAPNTLPLPQRGSLRVLRTRLSEGLGAPDRGAERHPGQGAQPPLRRRARVRPPAGRAAGRGGQEGTRLPTRPGVTEGPGCAEGEQGRPPRRQ
eukprot:1559456-Alexandrium_andersonii.AAC.1